MSASAFALPEFGQKNQNSLILCLNNLKVIEGIKKGEKLVFHHDGAVTKEEDSYSRSITGSLNAWGAYLISPSTSRDIRYLTLLTEALSPCALKEGRSAIDLWNIITRIKGARKGLEKLILTYGEQMPGKDPEIIAVKEAQGGLDRLRVTILNERTFLLTSHIDHYFSEFTSDLASPDVLILQKIAFVYQKAMKEITGLMNLTEDKIPSSPKDLYVKAMYKFLKLSSVATCSQKHFALAFSELVIYMFHPKKAHVLDSLIRINEHRQRSVPLADELLLTAHFFGQCYEPFLFFQNEIPWEQIVNFDSFTVQVDSEFGSFVKID